MATEDASLRQDLIENAVQHEVVPIDETIQTEQSLDASFAAELEHDLTIWPREYLETYLDSDDQGRIPLNEATLQDPSAEIRYPLIENGVYVGNIISETAEYLVQRISGTTAILHPKSMFSDLPQVGHVVRIAYYNENIAVREMAARQMSKELAR